ncbi:MAG: hypothetical protein ACRDQ4_02655 [Pseudonocardiaceae bacterium]
MGVAPGGVGVKETPELVGYLNARSTQRLITSALIEVEVPQALRRSEPAVLGAVAATIARIDRVESPPRP